MDEVTPEQAKALAIARQMVDAGIPVFAAAPCPDGCTTRGHARTEFHLPKAWQKIGPSVKQLERWRPGWGLAAIGGWTADFIDVDDHHGGDVSEKEIRARGMWPRVFGVQKTPSGGTHSVIEPIREHRAEGIMPGVDYQGGGEDGEGRAFIWLAPTVKRSKNVEDGGALGTYEWVTPFDAEGLAEFEGDESGQHIRDLVVASRGGVSAKATAPTVAAVPDDPFVTSSQITSAAAVRERRTFTTDSAWEFVQPVLKKLREAQSGEIEESANRAAVMLSHFVPAFMTAEQAYAILLGELAHTVYNPNGTSDWTAEKFIAVLDGSRPPRDAWRAEKVEVDSFAGRAVEAEASADEVDALIGRMFTAEQLAERPAPQPLVWDLLDKDSLAAVFAEPGSFKSFLALDLAGHIGRGMDWHGHRVEQGKVIYIAAEGDRGMTLRARAWMKKYGPMTDVLFLPEPVQVADPLAWNTLVKACARIKPVFVVADTQSMMTIGMEENSNTEMNVAMSAFRRIHKASQACVLVVHHTGKEGGKIRGGSAQEGAHDTRIKLERVGKRSDMFFYMKSEKQKDMAEGDNRGLKLRMETVDLGTDELSGRPLSSLVLSEKHDDAFIDASGQEESPDVGQQEAIPEPLSGWERVGLPAGSVMQERALQTLLEVAGPDGITEPRAMALVAERWHEGKTGRGKGALNKQSWQASWAKVLEREHEGETIIVRGSNSTRFRINDLVAGLVKTP